MSYRGKVSGAVSGLIALALIAGCGNSSTTPAASATPEFNAALTKVFNPSDKKGGVLKLAISSDWDSVDTADTYYALSWNLLRTYGRSLLMFKPVPGPEGNTLTGDLAEGLGTPSDGGKTWTYKLRTGLKFEDGSPITSRDVKYAVMRSHDKDVFVNGPTYLDDALDWQGYRGPYKDKGKDTTAITTPDDQTIVFHLKQSFGGFDYFAMLPATVPVPEAKDTGAKYKEHVVSSGPYMFDKYEAGKGFTLKRNPHWDPRTDPNRKALPDGYDVKIGINANDIDNQLISGDLHVDIAGTGVQPASLSKVLSDPAIKQHADNPATARIWYTSINPKAAPFENIECRKAVMYATDRTGYQRAYGGEFAGGAIATGLLPPLIPGFQALNVLTAGPDNTGDLAKAKEALAKCGKPDGFETTMAYRAERPKEKATAETFQQSLARVGIKLTLKGFPTKDYFGLYAGKPGFRNSNNLGLMTNGWSSDWNDGYGFLSQIVDSRVIRESGGSSNLSVMIPEVDALIDKALVEIDPKNREAIWAQIDKRVMEEAVVVPGVWAKFVTLRGKSATNVFVLEAFGQYDYLNMGVA